MIDNIKAGADIHVGDGGYKIGTKEKHEEFVKNRNKSLGESRIKEFAKHAGITTNLDTDFYVKKDYNAWVDYFAAKFAELIVKECSDVCQQVTDSGLFDGKQQYASAYCRDEIKRHFGIEE